MEITCIVEVYMPPTQFITKSAERYRHFVEVYYIEPLDANHLVVGSFIQNTTEFDISLETSQRQTISKREKELTGFLVMQHLKTQIAQKKVMLVSSSYIKSFNSCLFYFLYDTSQNKRVL